MCRVSESEIYSYITDAKDAGVNVDDRGDASGLGYV